MATLLELVQDIIGDLPISTTVSVVVGSSDPTISQIRRLIQREGNELVSKNEWSRVLAAWTFTVATDPQTETYPSDYERLRKRSSFWRSGSNLTPLSGPVPPDNWHYIETNASSFPGFWRPFGNGVEFIGVPIGETVTAEYVSKNWILAADGETTRATWAADTDTSMLPDTLLTLGVVWRWKQSKGLEYAEDMATYERELDRRISADRSARPILTTRVVNEGRFPPSTWPGQVATS
jgi:hypothetical protein